MGEVEGVGVFGGGWGGYEVQAGPREAVEMVGATKRSWILLLSPRARRKQRQRASLAWRTRLMAESKGVGAHGGASGRRRGGRNGAGSAK